MTSVPRNGVDGGGASPTPAVRSEDGGAEAGGTVVIVVRSDATEGSGDRNAGALGEGKVAEAQRQKQEKEAKKGESVVIDVMGGGGGAEGEDELDGDEEKVCRICHLSPERDGGGGSEGSELIQIGCGCKDELGTAHRQCAEAWFRVKGNRCCEICGLNAKNINGEDDGRFMEEWYDRRTLDSSSNRNSSERVSCWRGQPFCNCLMACLVIAFILPWFFRVNMF